MAGRYDHLGREELIALMEWRDGFPQAWARVETGRAQYDAAWENRREWRVVEHDARADRNFLDRALRPELLVTY